MSLAVGQWQVRGLVMGAGTIYRVAASSSSFALNTRDEQSQNRPHSHGGLVGSEWANPRVIPIRVFVDTTEHTELSWLEAIDELANAFRPAGSTGEMVELYRNVGGREIVYFGRTRMVEPDEELAAGGYGWVHCAFEAADPRRYSATLTTVSTSLPVQQGGLTVPARVSTTRLRLPDVSGAYASTPNHASLQITGDFSLRAGLDLRSWTDGFQQLVTRYGSAGAISYALNVDSSGFPRIQWSADGTAVLTATASLSMSGVSQFLWLRGDLDVNNGAAGRTATFFTGPTRSGPWTAFGSPVVQAGVTSVFAGSAPLEIGSRTGGTTQTIRGTVTGAEVRNSAGTVVADPDFTNQSVGTTSFADATGKTWTVHGTARLVGDTYRGGLTAPFTIPGVLAGGKLELVNSGTTDTGLTVRIDGPAVEPRLILQRPDGTAQSIRFTIDLADGQWLEIDSTRHLALLNGLPESNQRGNAVWDLDAYPLQPGTNVLRFLSGVYDADAALTVSHRSAWW